MAVSLAQFYREEFSQQSIFVENSSAKSGLSQLAQQILLRKFPRNHHFSKKSVHSAHFAEPAFAKKIWWNQFCKTKN